FEKSLPEEPVCAVREVIYDYPKFERKLPKRKSKFLNKIHKKLFPMWKKDNTSRAQDTETLHGLSAKVIYDYE
ncbi:hypothetical protein NDU88_010463, partial [Pleurodeles waltl]